MSQITYSMWSPSIVEETSAGMSIIPLQSKHFTDRKLFINGEVTDMMANDFVSEFLHLAQTDEPVDIYLNTPGGSVLAGLLIYDIIQDIFKSLTNRFAEIHVISPSISSWKYAYIQSR